MAPNIETNDNKKQHKLYKWLVSIEPLLYLLIISMVITYALWELLAAPNTAYPGGVDGMGHLTRIPYIADCLKHLNWPSWFPFWYNGATTTQYYPPLCFYLLAPIQMIYNNIMVCYKFCAFFSLFVGAAGVWYICYRWIGPFVGIGGAVLYAVQPYLIRTIVSQGSIAQGPIIALTPWFLFCTLLFLEKRSAFRWMSVCIVTSLLILSHAMHALLISIGLAVFVFVMLILRRINIIDFLFWGTAVAFGAGLVSFWWMPGATQLENPGVPYVLTYAARELYTANIDWFNPLMNRSGGYYFSLSIMSVAFLTVLWLKKPQPEYNSSDNLLNTKNLTISLLIALLFGIILSLGDNIPFYKYIPMSGSLFPSRILSFSSLLAALLCAIFFRELAIRCRTIICCFLCCTVITFFFYVVLVDVSPSFVIDIKTYDDLRAGINQVPTRQQAFDNGRFAWFMPLGSEISYFPMTNNLNMTDGWNIEGTPHMYSLWLHNTAIYAKFNDYVMKNIYHWNVRSILVSNRYTSLKKALEKSGFSIIKSEPEKTLYFNNSPSSYIMEHKRNALVVGKSAPGLEMAFPWMVQGYSSSLEAYPEEYLQLFKLIYLAEPEIKDFNKLQNMIEKMAGSGKTVIIEMGRAKTLPLFDTYPYWESIPADSKLVPTKESPFTQEILLEPDPSGQAAAIGNLDEVWMEMIAGEKHVPAVGFKNVNGNRVFFIGLSLGQRLESSVKWTRGGLATSSDSKEIENLLEQIVNRSDAQKSILPPPFPVSNNKWYHNGFSFSYNTEQAKPVLISVTYTPRWKATIDGTPLKVYNMENLLLVKLPAGKHQVSFKYGMTWVGLTGVGLSIISFLMMIIIAFRLEQLRDLINNIWKAVLIKVSDT